MSNFMKSLPMGAGCRMQRTDRQTDMTKLVVVFRNFPQILRTRLKKILPARGKWGDASSANTETS